MYQTPNDNVNHINLQYSLSTIFCQKREINFK